MGGICFLRGESHLQKYITGLQLGHPSDGQWVVMSKIESGYEDSDWDDTSLPDLPDVDSD